jgi:heme-degrading monooxygenase HmoA
MTLCCHIEEEFMLNIQPLDTKVPITRQIDAESPEPVVLLNIFKVEASEAPKLLEAWRRDANWMKKQPGFISTQFHEGVAGSNVFMNYAVWESVAHFRQAFTHPDFRNSLKDYPSSAVASPHLFKRLSISNLCVGP